MEIWKPIDNYGGYYEISSYGRVRSLPRVVYTIWRNGKSGKYLQKGRILKPKECSRNKKGYQTYLQVCLSINGNHKYFLIHRLVAKAFIPNENGYPQVNHKDGNKHNNVVENLEWVTAKENVKHSFYVLPNSIVKTVRCIETDKTFESTSKAAHDMGIHQSSISMSASGKRKTAGGYHWEYLRRQ